MINPYEEVGLQNAERVLSVSHQHLSHTSETIAQNNFNDIYNSGVRHFAISRYRPSIITYPFNYENNSFIYVGNQFDTTETIEQLKENYAFKIQAHGDVIGCPNAEHVYPLLRFNENWSKWSSIHINAIGSAFESGLTPLADGYQNTGLEVSYSEAYTKMLKKLQYPDAGGIIINHPKWTNDSKHFEYDIQRFMMDSLDFDQRVLGTDVIENGTQTAIDFNTAMIDNILSTGRRCWIFAQGDWNMTRGRNELLIPTGLTREEKEYACLRAYRTGAFFGRYANTNLSITSIGMEDGNFTVTAANADGIKVTIDGITTDYSGVSVSVPVPNNATYVRAMAYTNRDNDPNWTYSEDDVYKDVVFTNPIMVNEKRYAYNPAYDIVPEKKTKSMPLWLYG